MHGVQYAGKVKSHHASDGLECDESLLSTSRPRHTNPELELVEAAVLMYSDSLIT